MPEAFIVGNANGAGEESRNVARMAAPLAGPPVKTPGGPGRVRAGVPPPRGRRSLRRGVGQGLATVIEAV